MIDDETHIQALASGRLRYCPICDGFEVTDRSIAVIGTGQRGCTEALFLRGYTADITLVAPGSKHELSARELASVRDAGIKLAERTEEHTSELQSLMSISYAVLGLKKKKQKKNI